MSEQEALIHNLRESVALCRDMLRTATDNFITLPNSANHDKVVRWAKGLRDRMDQLDAALATYAAQEE